MYPCRLKLHDTFNKQQAQAEVPSACCITGSGMYSMLEHVLHCCAPVLQQFLSHPSVS